MQLYRLPPIDMISGPQISHQLNLALLHSEILHIKTAVHTLKWNWNKTASNSCEAVLYQFHFNVILSKKIILHKFSENFPRFSKNTPKKTFLA